MAARPSSTKVRRECFDANKRVDETGRIYLVCHICGGMIDPIRDRWEAEHPTPHANGGVKTLPAHEACHDEKTPRDISEIAKGKRVADRHFGIRRSSGSFRKAPPGFKYDWRSRRLVKEDAS